jgi:hypothetical protein
MMGDNRCEACGGSGWVEVRTRGMCGVDCDFGEVERQPCESCNSEDVIKVETRLAQSSPTV